MLSIFGVKHLFESKKNISKLTKKKSIEQVFDYFQTAIYQNISKTNSWPRKSMIIWNQLHFNFWEANARVLAKMRYKVVLFEAIS